MANSRQQYWHSYFRPSPLPEAVAVVVVVEEEEESEPSPASGGPGRSTDSSSSDTWKPKSLRRGLVLFLDWHWIPDMISLVILASIYPLYRRRLE